ncbi:TonB-dependent receptor [Coraliomargarita sp. SDUM461004]|uniref:TonB-dependent receptor n=1 Tax=Thalassobacterium sedimentorum TaxID=3041258 RepID=A0ABU1AGM8_9BACT|nr:TonB-dependent receptor [Coraliomargarita sp. SDUM461004]MDQ8193985.1 TonB-dependent receptor [Coraliomargarita sp. SDUM461004]
MYSISKQSLIYTASCLILAGAVSAADLTGYVTDQKSGNALEGVKVTLPELKLDTTTSRSGYYSFSGIDAGEYTVVFDYIGANKNVIKAAVSETHAELTDVALTLSFYELTDFEVSAYESANAKALNLQRSSENLRNVVSADLFGQFADTNAAEALNRLPGISVERDQGEGRFVIIRGIDPNLNSVAIDGVTLAAPSAGERSTLLDTIPIEVLNTLEVTKAVTPDQPGDSIGGYINLRTPSAFDFDGRAANLSSALLYSDLVDEAGYKFNGFYADTFGAEKEWGLFLSFVNSERTFGSDNVESDEWVEEGGSWVPDDTIEYREYDLVRERTGLSAAIEYKPSEDRLFFLRTSYNEYTDTEVRDLSASSFAGDFSGVSDSSFNNDEIESVVELKEREENMRIFVTSIGGEQTFSDWSVNYTLAYSRAEEETPYDREVIYEADGTSSGTVSNASGYQPHLGGATAGVDYSDPSIFEFDELTIGDQLVEETDISGKLDVKRDFNDGVLRYVKFGGIARAKTKESDFDQRSADDDTGIETANLFRQSSRRNPFHRPTPSLDTGIFNYAEGNLLFVDDVVDSTIEDYETDEDVLAAYLMASFNIGEWELIAGARVEHTDFSTEGFAYDEDTDTISDVKFDKDYTNLLPGIHLRREFGDELVARASWTNTIARPTFDQSRPGIEREGNEVTRGNPDLDPYESMNFDASLQYYSQDYGVFGFAVFYKDIENFIYEQTFDVGPDEVTTFENGESGDILGVELSYSKQLDFLPGAFRGLSVQANLTLTDSEADAQRPDGGEMAQISFLRQSDMIGNLSLAWEYDRYYLRISGSYRDDYLDELGEESYQDRYVDDFFQVDLYGSIRLYNGVSVFAEVNNLFNEPLRAYWGESGRLAQHEEYGVSGSVGVKWRF